MWMSCHGDKGKKVFDINEVAVRYRNITYNQHICVHNSTTSRILLFCTRTIDKDVSSWGVMMQIEQLLKETWSDYNNAHQLRLPADWCCEIASLSTSSSISISIVCTVRKNSILLQRLICTLPEDCANKLPVHIAWLIVISISSMIHAHIWSCPYCLLWHLQGNQEKTTPPTIAPS